MTFYKVSLYYEEYNFETHKSEFGPSKTFYFKDYDSVQNLIGYMSEGNDDVLIRIRKEETFNEQ